MDEIELRRIEWPDHLYNMKEFRFLDEISDKMMSEFEAEVEARHDDILVTTATEIGIARREKILGILSNPDEDIEVRRARVLFWWYNRMPYTEKVLKSKISALCGEGNYTFEYDDDDETLYVGINIDLGWNVIDTVYELLDELVMLNVLLDIRGTKVETVTTPLYTGVQTRAYAECATLTDSVAFETTLYLGSKERKHINNPTISID